MATESTRSTRRTHVIYKAADGERLPGTTTVVGLLAKDLTGWAFKIGQENPGLSSLREHIDDLARVGSLVHHYADSRLRGTVAETDDWTPNELKAAAPAMKKFDDWLDGNTVKVLSSERQLISEQYRYGGTLDIFAEINGRRALVDLKTGRNIYREHWLQLAAYAQLLQEAGEVVNEVTILRAGRVGAEGFEVRTIQDWSLYLDAFLSLRALYATLKQIDKAENAGGI